MYGFQSIKAVMICSAPHALQVREIKYLYLGGNCRRRRGSHDRSGLLRILLKDGPWGR